MSKNNLNIKHWFIINGYARSGKGEFVKRLNNYIPTISISTVDIIKKICLELGWDGNKDENGRLVLSEFKDLSTKYFDHSFNYVKNELDKFKNNDNDNLIFTVDSREPKEIKRFVDELDFKTIFINNINITNIPNNHADKNVLDYKYDYVINNNGTLEELDLEVQKFIKNNL